MARFGISDIIDARSKELGKGGINEYKEIWGNSIDRLDEWKANIRGVDLKNYQPDCKVL